MPFPHLQIPRIPKAKGYSAQSQPWILLHLLRGTSYASGKHRERIQLVVDVGVMVPRVIKLHEKAVDDGTIFEGPDMHHLFLTVHTPSNANLPSGHHTSPYMMLGHWIGSSDDGDAPPWTRYMTPDYLYRFRQPRAFMARMVAGLTPIWIGDLVERGTLVENTVKYQRRRLAAREAVAAPTRWVRGRNLRRHSL
ncbi:hypothetical protein K438DRAFT_1774762 [Mycena galopus ATCC 62051]|nr:hypothetical protein K438DRAFT_1774762 [Mycena galopus ATCC 62051]